MKSTVVKEETRGIVHYSALRRDHAVLLLWCTQRLQVHPTMLKLSTIGLLLAIVTSINPHVINAGHKTEGTAS